MEFNRDKCSVMTFGKVRYPLIHEYKMDGIPIPRVQNMKDLGVIFDKKLTFHDHINTVAADSFRRLGFVLRNSREFHSPLVIRLLYYALVRSKLETSTCVWHPYEAKYGLILEKVQKAFLRYLYKRCYGYYPFLYPTKFLLGCLGFNSLEVRRICDQLKIMCQILRGDVNAPELHDQLCRIRVPESNSNLRPRKNKLFVVPHHRTVARSMSPIPRSLASFNALLDNNAQWDPFNDGSIILVRELLKYAESIA